MIRCKYITALFLLFISFANFPLAQQAFVATYNNKFLLEGKPYYYIGTNYWYGSLVANDNPGKERVKKELDFLKKKGIHNLRILGGVEGEGLINGNPRVGPVLQSGPGKFREEVLNGLDFLLAEMKKRNMKAVIYLSNNWEWSGGFLQYLNWNKKIADSVLQRKLEWDEMRDYISLFYTCQPCIEQYRAQAAIIINRKNSISGTYYKDDPVIMAWQIANEPRPMRPHAINAYKEFISGAASYIKSLDKNHLVTIGSEGEIGSENMQVFRDVHANSDIDYATIHIWPKNWGWYSGKNIAAGFDTVAAKTKDYISRHNDKLNQLGKPLVIEEFGLPRDGHSFSLTATTTMREKYYKLIFDELVKSIKNNNAVTGANFWVFSGVGRPSGNPVWWKKGDDVLGDPPMEEQGLYSVFDSDKSTWKLIKKYTGIISNVLKK